jgi:hypothetical protein
VLRQLPGLPEEGFATLVGTLSRICEDPRDRTFSVPLSADGQERLAELDDGGFKFLSVNARPVSSDLTDH